MKSLHPPLKLTPPTGPLASELFSRRWPDGTPRFNRSGEPFRSRLQRSMAKHLDICLCHYYSIPLPRQIPRYDGITAGKTVFFFLNCGTGRAMRPAMKIPAPQCTAALPGNCWRRLNEWAWFATGNTDRLNFVMRTPNTPAASQSRQVSTGHTGCRQPPPNPPDRHWTTRLPRSL
jgi:hypothetical protein